MTAHARGEGAPNPPSLIFPDEMPELLQYVSAFDASQIAFKRNCTRFFYNPTFENIDDARNGREAVVDAYRSLTKAIFESEEDTTARITSLANLHIDAIAKRTKLFSQLSGCQEYDTYQGGPDNSVLRGITDLFIDTASDIVFLDKLVEIFDYDSAADLDHFFGDVLSQQS